MYRVGCWFNKDLWKSPSSCCPWYFCPSKKKNFSLKSMLNRPGSNLPSDPSVHLNPETAKLIDLDEIAQADGADHAHEGTRDRGEAKPKKSPSLSWCRTHNDRLIVSTCGIILSRRTFYNAEASSALRVRNFQPRVCPWFHSYIRRNDAPSVIL